MGANRRLYDAGSASTARPEPLPGDVEPAPGLAQRVVAQNPAGELLVRDDDGLAAERAQVRVGEADVVDHAVALLHLDPVADSDRLGDREHDAGDEVGERLAGGEAEDRGGDRARGEERAG